MKNKIGFTLAEILIVLTIIGVMAVMTIPSLMQNANSQHKIALFKKAFNAVSNAYATEFATKTPPTYWNDGGSNAGGRRIFNALAKQLNVKYYMYNPGEGDTFIKTFNEPPSNFLSYEYWIVTEDNISYKVTSAYPNTKCKTQLEMNAFLSTTDAQLGGCMNIMVNVDGPSAKNFKNPICDEKADLNKLSNCLIRFFQTTTGITAGNSDCTISGRIMSDNTTYDESKCTTTP